MEKRNLYWSKKAAGESKGVGDRWSRPPKGKVEKIENRVGGREEMKPLTQDKLLQAAPAYTHNTPPPSPTRLESYRSWLCPTARWPNWVNTVPEQRWKTSQHAFAPDTGAPGSHNPLSLFPVQPEIFPGWPSPSVLPALEYLIWACVCAIYPAKAAALITATQPWLWASWNKGDNKPIGLSDSKLH